MRPDVARARTFWITRRQPFMLNHLAKLAFVDETSLKTNMIKTTGWAPVGERLIDQTPFGHWNTQTFIAAPRKKTAGSAMGDQGGLSHACKHALPGSG